MYVVVIWVAVLIGPGQCTLWYCVDGPGHTLWLGAVLIGPGQCTLW